MLNLFEWLTYARYAWCMFENGFFLTYTLNSVSSYFNSRTFKLSLENLFIWRTYLSKKTTLSDAKKGILHELDTFNCFKNIPLNFTDVHSLNNVAQEITRNATTPVKCTS